MTKPPFKRIHISRTSVVHRIVFHHEQWTIEAWCGKVTPFLNVYQRAPTLRAVKEIIDAMSEQEMASSVEITIMIDSVVTPLQSDTDWALVILSEPPDTFTGS